MVKEWNFANGNAPAGLPIALRNYTHAQQVTNFSPQDFMVEVPDPTDATRRIWQHRWVAGNAESGFHDLPGVPGQNTPNPLAFFSAHAVVKIGDKLYDPSYGATYDWTEANPLGDFQTKAIAGYFIGWDGGGFRYFLARPKSTTDDREINGLFALIPLRNLQP